MAYFKLSSSYLCLTNLGSPIEKLQHLWVDTAPNQEKTTLEIWFSVPHTKILLFGSHLQQVAPVVKNGFYFGHITVAKVTGSK